MIEPKCTGIKRWTEFDIDGGLAWALFGPDVSDEEIHREYPRVSGGPGQYFQHTAWITRTKRRTLVRLDFGWDI